MRELQLLDGRRAELSALHAEADADVAALRKQYDAEQKDVDRLEGVSLTRVLAALRGGREDALAREKAEAESARYRLFVAQDHRAALAAELAAVGERRGRAHAMPAPDRGGATAKGERA